MRSTILVDLDGCLVNSYSRTPHVSTEEFSTRMAQRFNDKILNYPLNKPIHDFLVAFEASNYRIIFLTARQEFMRANTKAWLSRYGWAKYHLVMRPPEDVREDSVYKVGRYQDVLKDVFGKDVAFIIDDQPAVIDAFWEQERIPGFCFKGGMIPWEK